MAGGWQLLGEGLKAGGESGLQRVPLLAVVFLLAGFAEVLIAKGLVAR